MIRVNLLPVEYRKAEATPLKQFFATVGAAVVVALAVVGWLYVRFGMLQPTQKPPIGLYSARRCPVS